MLGQGAGVAHGGGEQRVVDPKALWIDQGDVDPARLEERTIEQPRPVVRLAAEIDDANLSALGEDRLDQLDHAPRPGPPEAR